MKESYYIDCREYTPQQVEEVCKELERLGYKFHSDWSDNHNKASFVYGFDQGIYGVYIHQYNPSDDDNQITLEELKNL